MNYSYVWYIPRSQLLDHMATLFLVFRGTSTLLSIVMAPIYIPTNSVGEFLFSQPFKYLLSADFLMILCCPFGCDHHSHNHHCKGDQQCCSVSAFFPPSWEPDASSGVGLQGRLSDRYCSLCVEAVSFFPLEISLSQQAPVSLLRLPVLLPGPDILESEYKHSWDSGCSITHASQVLTFHA